MKKEQPHLDESSPRTVTEFIPIHNGRQRIKIGFTDQRLSPHAGLSSFAGFLHRQRLKDQLAALMPQRTSPNAQPAADLALGYVVGVLAGAKKLAQVGFCAAIRCCPRCWGSIGCPALRVFHACFGSLVVRSKTATVLGRCGGGVWGA